MEIFSRIQQPYRWFVLSKKNVGQLLSTPPYRQDNKIFAICPYCLNPVRVILKKDPNNNYGHYYAKHLHTSPFANREVDQERLAHCILRNKAHLLSKGAIPVGLDLSELDVRKVRKALYYLVHISMSNSFVKKLLNETKNAVYYSDADKYNYPFMMLLEMKYVLLNHRHLAYYPQLIKAIEDNSKYFSVTKSKHEVVPKTDNARLYFVFDGQGINNKLNLNYLKVNVLEVNKARQYSAKIFDFKVYLKGFESLL